MLPITLTRLGETLAVVVGGGLVGERKVSGLIEAGANVRLISPKATSQLAKWAESGKIEWLRRPYCMGDLDGARLAFAATNLRTVNHEVAAEAHRRGLLVNVADQPEEGNFHVPAVHRDHDLIIAVSTQARRPRLAVAVRNWIAESITRILRNDDEDNASAASEGIGSGSHLRDAGGDGPV